MKTRGYFGVVFYEPKYEENIGSLIRSANIFGASFFGTIGKKYKHQASDTLKSTRHIPLFHYSTFEELKNSLDKNCKVVAIELSDLAREINGFSHPKNAVYIVGSEFNGIPEDILNECDYILKLGGDISMNVACAGSIVLHHRACL